MNEWKQEFEGKKILIYGYGMEGKGTYRLIRELCPDLEITIADGGRGKDIAEKETVHTNVISDKALDLNAYDLIMKSPGIVLKKEDRENPEILKKISGEAQLFLKHYGDRTIGITGTKGKSTTTSLTAALLKEKYTCELVGNIGRSCFDVIEVMESDPDALAAFEISCHQLEYCPYSPHIGVYLNLYEEHLDHYESFEKYGEAKSHVLSYQKKGDIAIVDERLRQYQNMSGADQYLIGKDIYAEGKTLYIPNHSLSIEECSLIGSHNYQNLAAAYMIARYYGVSDEQVKHAVKEFNPLRHRLQDCGVIDGIRYVNDSISTIGQAAIAAVNALEDVQTILIGGMDRGISYTELEDFLYEQKDLNVIFMYASGKRVYEELQEKDMMREGYYTVENLEEAVRLSKEITEQGKTVLLSPAASSYDHFKNFEQRGDVFMELIRQ